MQQKKVWVVGNLVRDTYINLDPNHNHFEFDDKNRPWLDLDFSEKSYNYFQQTTVSAGAAVTLEVLSRQGIAAGFAESGVAFRDGQVVIDSKSDFPTRFILCHNQNVAYLTPTERAFSNWQAPADAVDWVYVDRSAELSQKTLTEIEQFLSLAHQTHLAVYLQADSSPLTRALAAQADLLFVEAGAAIPKEDSRAHHKNPLICRILPDKIQLGEAEILWRPEKAGFLTHLTTHSVIAATLFAALLNQRSLTDALLLAKINAENTSLDGSLAAAELERAYQDYQNARINLREIAASMVAPGKGILAADESGGNTSRQFSALDIINDEQHRRDYRNLLLSLPTLKNYVNAVILFDETTRQKADDGSTFVDFLTARGIIPGVKVDAGLEAFPGSLEKFTRGLDGLQPRMRQYFEQGLRFAKWRAAFEIHKNITAATADYSVGLLGANTCPTEPAVRKICADLASYAKICQTEGIVPIVEPEVVHAGDYSIEECATVLQRVLEVLFEELAAKKVDLKACILKCNMVLAGSERPQSTPEEVAQATSAVLRAAVPEGLAGVVFLSGGQGVEQATENLAAIEKLGPYPWPVTFSFARALQSPALETWRGDNQNIPAAQAQLEARLRANCAALKIQS